MMERNKRNRLLTTGIVGATITAICCFTPALVVLLGILGLGAATGYLDYALLPALAIFAGLIAYGLWLKTGRGDSDSSAKVD